MERIYIDGDSARFTRRDITLVDMELSDGRAFEKLEPRRLFPVSERNRYIALLDENGIEQAIIRDVRTLPADQQALINACLTEYYLIPKITKIVDFRERYDGITLYTETDRGSAQIEIRNLDRGLKMDRGARVLVRDINDNRYEIPDVTKLDKHSRQILGRYM